jgi:hypothetical protein
MPRQNGQRKPGTTRGSPWVRYTPKLKKRTALLRTLADIFRRHRSQPVGRVIQENQFHLAGLGELFRGGPRKPLLLVHSLLGRTKGAAAFDAECEASGRRLATVASGVDVPNAGPLRGLSRAAPRSDSGRGPIGLITLEGKAAREAECGKSARSV